jgi:hypothetical protein
MRLSLWLGVLGCLCLWACHAQADPTVQDFNKPGGTPYTLTNFGGDPADDTQAGPGGKKLLRLTQATNGGLNTCAFDRTQTGPVGHVVADFDFRIGDSTDGRSHGADGLAFVLLNTQAAINGNMPPDGYGITADGPQITEEASAYQSIGFGLDTWHNNPLPAAGGIGDPNDNHISVIYSDAPIRDFSETAGLGVNLQAVSLTPFGYHLHRATLPDNDPLDHFHMALDVATGGGANVTVTITPASGTAFTPINNLFLPTFVPYEMRVAFGGRTGGENENHDVANINVTFAPP